MSEATAILARIDELEALAHSPGNLKCDACGFVMTFVNLNVAAGTVSAGDRAERCPNDNTLMRRLTERERADSWEQGYMQLIEERNGLRDIIRDAMPLVLELSGSQSDAADTSDIGAMLDRMEAALP